VALAHLASSCRAAATMGVGGMWRALPLLAPAIAQPEHYHVLRILRPAEVTKPSAMIAQPPRDGAECQGVEVFQGVGGT
jgi:hypothetical protein